MRTPDHYRILGVPRDAEIDAIRRAYHSQARRLHPDLHPGDAATVERLRDLNEARRVLSDPGRRREYDDALAAAEGSGPYRPDAVTHRQAAATTPSVAEPMRFWNDLVTIADAVAKVFDIIDAVVHPASTRERRSTKHQWDASVGRWRTRGGRFARR